MNILYIFFSDINFICMVVEYKYHNINEIFDTI